VQASQTSALQRLPIDMSAVVDTQDVNALGLVVYTIQQPVGRPVPSVGARSRS